MAKKTTSKTPSETAKPAAVTSKKSAAVPAKTAAKPTNKPSKNSSTPTREVRKYSNGGRLDEDTFAETGGPGEIKSRGTGPETDKGE
ncbi:MAG: hypothetical protein ACRYG7_07025 [Janthinobacterium lividum]